MSTHSLPKHPNILVTGTPGTGKTTLSYLLASEFGMEHIEIGKVVREHNFYSEYDPTLDTHITDEESEDRLLDYLEPLIIEGGKIIDYHTSGLFPERWFHIVLILHAHTDVLFDRLTKRGYNDVKKGENIDAEIHCICEEEALESYRPEIVLIKYNNIIEDMEQIVEEVGGIIEKIKI